MFPTDPRHRFGQASETRAEQFLIAKGYRILDRNVRLSIGELDRRKRAKLSKLAAQYLAQRHWSDKLCRFDVVLVQGQPSAPEQIEHIPNAFDVTEL